MRSTIAAPAATHAETGARAFWPEVLESLDHKPAQNHKTKCVVGADCRAAILVPAATANQGKA